MTTVTALGRYRVLKHLASGGMADVVLGRADGIEGFERHVVLKRIRAEHARDRRFISMFVDEARLAAGLHHQHIVQVFDIGEAQGEYFFAMEYIHGEDVRKLLSAVAQMKAYVPLNVVCAIVSAVAAGLHYAHDRRDSKGRPLDIVHRDVSPSNVIIGYDGAVKIVDFGIAKATARHAETLAGSLKGKCSYMSPEQCKSDPVDRRSDVYGLGVLLYELATTARLFKGDNDYLVMDGIVNGRFALPQVRRPDLPNELSTIITRALATDRTRRYQTAEELRVELEQFATKHELNATSAALASYMRKIFGTREEPWLDLTTEPEVAGQSWSSTLTGGHRNSMRTIVASVGIRTPRSVTALETGPTLRLGWEATRHLHGARTGKWRWAAVPVVAVAALAVWKLGLDRDSARATVEAGAEMTVAALPVASPESPESPALAVPRVVGPPSVPASPAEDLVPPTTIASDVEPPPVEASAPAPTKLRSAKRAMPPAVVPASTTSPMPTPTTPTAATVGAAAAVDPALAVAAAVAAAEAASAPRPVAPTQDDAVAAIAMLSNASVAATASEHAGQLAACEGNARLSGDVAVSFQIDATGKVVRSQLMSTIKNPKVAGCILRAVQSWKFAKPPTGSAKGVYSISYQ
jgi:serine/threonine protein kinase/outer membrane biosynthesis protein TonB